MSATTVNAFPPLHAFNSSRAWFLAAIVLLHAGFFWVLTHGVTIGSLEIQPPVIVDFLPDKTKVIPPRPEPTPPEPVTRGRLDPIPVPQPAPIDETPSEKAPTGRTMERTPAGAGSAVPVPAPVVVEPMIDPRIGLSEPEYPVSSIRQQHEGTVWLSVEVLPNGRVGQVRLDQSSGYARLDESAMREARKWRMKPGMQDGVATTMWKRVPITFRLKN